MLGDGYQGNKPPGHPQPTNAHEEGCHALGGLVWADGNRLIRLYPPRFGRVGSSFRPPRRGQAREGGTTREDPAIALVGDVDASGRSSPSHSPLARLRPLYAFLLLLSPSLARSIQSSSRPIDGCVCVSVCGAWSRECLFVMRPPVCGLATYRSIDHPSHTQTHTHTHVPSSSHLQGVAAAGGAAAAAAMGGSDDEIEGRRGASGRGGRCVVCVWGGSIDGWLAGLCKCMGFCDGVCTYAMGERSTTKPSVLSHTNPTPLPTRTCTHSSSRRSPSRSRSRSRDRNGGGGSGGKRRRGGSRSRSRSGDGGGGGRCVFFVWFGGGGGGGACGLAAWRWWFVCISLFCQ